MKNLMTKTKWIASFLLVMMFAGCQKESNTTTPQPGDNNSSEGSIVIADRTFEGLNGIVFGQISASGLKSADLGLCPLITATLNAPIAITFDWGTGCTSAEDGITRSGKIVVSVSGLMNVANSAVTFTFINFVSAGNKITGVHTITYNGLNAGNNWPRYTVFTDAKIEFPDKKFITYKANHVRLHAEGATTLILADDVWHIEGTSSGTTREGIAWTADYNNALVKKNSCKWFSAGSIIVTPEGLPSCTIDYGDGTCDNDATLTIGDKTINIKL